MRRRPDGKAGGQGKSEGIARQTPRQLMLPMISGVLATQEALFGLVQQSGLLVIREVFAEEAEKVAGPKGRRQANRGANQWGVGADGVSLCGAQGDPEASEGSRC